jgi:hypothetical protein
MWRIIKRFIVSFYVKGMKVRFYLCPIQLTTEPFKTFVVTTQLVYQLTFHFHREDNKYLQYFKRRYHRQAEKILALTVKVGEEAPESLRYYENTMFYVRLNRVTKLDEETLSRILLEAFVDNMILDLQTTTKPI